MCATAACSDSPTGAVGTPGPGGPLLTMAPTVSLDAQIDAMIADFFPTGLETTTGSRWQTVKERKSANDLAGAKKHYVTLADWIKKKTLEIALDAAKYPDVTTKQQAATRLVFAMSLWLFEGPDAQLPQLAPDSKFAVVPAGAAADIVTDSKQAAIQLDLGSTDEDRVFVIVQDGSSYPGICNGPLDTPFCQYPLFYRFDSYPKTPLKKVARFAICLENGDRSPLDGAEQHEVHDRLRLAHEAPPADLGPAARTPGGKVIGNIEVLPLATRGSALATCTEIHHAMGPDAPRGGWLGRGQRALFAVADLAARFFTPKDLYAYDSGPEHYGLFFSHFNAVDTLSRPDVSATDFSIGSGGVTSLAAASTAVTAGGTLDVSFAVANASPRHSGAATARSAPVTADIVLSRPVGDLAATSVDDPPLAQIEIPALRPDDRFPASGVETRAVTIPLSAEVINTPTTYTLSVRVSASSGLPEVSLGNNVASASITVNPRPADVSVASGPTVTSEGPFVAGGPITFAWAARNSGYTDAGALLRRFTLSTNQTLGDADDRALGDQAHGVVAAQTTTGELTSTQTLPSDLAVGSYYVFLTLDPTGVVVESNDANNSAVSTTAFEVIDPVREWTFTTCGAIGAFGPTQSQCNSAYAGTPLASTVTVVEGIQTWTAPAAGTYRITAVGAQGAAGQPDKVGGRGAEIAGDFTLAAGSQLRLVVGQMGVGQSSSNNGGGGGGSFVVGSSDEPLIIAGGGGGTRLSADRNGCDASTGQFGVRGAFGASTACVVKTVDRGLGGGLLSTSWGSGGAGFGGDGANDLPWGNGGKSWVHGLTGGLPVDGACVVGTVAAFGGFGGGGSGNGCWGGGGGGGYSGGDGGLIAGGGGSFNAGTNPSAIASVGTRDGRITIVRVGR